MNATIALQHVGLARAVISAEDIATYERDGAVIIRDAVSADWIDAMRSAVDEVLRSPTAFASENTPPGEAGRFYGDTFVWLSQPRFAQFILESPLAELAGRIMRAERVNFFYDQLLVKEPGTASRTPWHQDLPYWPVRGWQIA